MGLDSQIPSVVSRLAVDAAWVDCLDMERACSLLRWRLRNRMGGVVAAVNPEKCISSRTSPELRRFLHGADLLIPDGVGVVIFGWLSGYRSMGRVPGCDLALELCREASAQREGVFLLGATEESSSRAERFLADRFGAELVTGRKNGYCDLSDGQEVIHSIVASDASILLVALGSPKQELFIDKVRAAVPHMLILGVGGTFDVWAGAVTRAPKLFQRFGLEWAYRLGRQPSRLRRQLRLVRFLPTLFKAMSLRHIWLQRSGRV